MCANSVLREVSHRLVPGMNGFVVAGGIHYQTLKYAVAAV